MSRNRRWSIVAIAVLGGTVLGGCGKPAECGDCYAEGYRVEFSSVPSGTEPPPAVLFSGWRNGWCQDDLVCTGAPDVYLGDLSHGPLPWHKACGAQDQELIAFAGGHAPTIAAFDPSASDVLHMTLAPAVKVRAAVWAVGSSITIEDAYDRVVQASGVLVGLGTGIELEPDINDFPPTALATVPDLHDNASCDLVGKIVGLSGNGYVDKQLNIYFVGGFSASAGNPAALDCYRADAPDLSHQNIIFILGSLWYTPAALAHEVGHALGLLRTAPLPGGGETGSGHVNDLLLAPYVAEDNLMRSGLEHVGQATVGQIYRMHFDQLSWLWHDRAWGADYPRECQNSAVDGGPCPPLTLHPPRGWP